VYTSIAGLVHSLIHTLLHTAATCKLLTLTMLTTLAHNDSANYPVPLTAPKAENVLVYVLKARQTIGDTAVSYRGDTVAIQPKNTTFCHSCH
jgi:hypothetical protein